MYSFRFSHISAAAAMPNTIRDTLLLRVTRSSGGSCDAAADTVRVRATSSLVTGLWEGDCGDGDAHGGHALQHDLCALISANDSMYTNAQAHPSATTNRILVYWWYPTPPSNIFTAIPTLYSKTMQYSYI
jgi:hypothetical protein